MVHIDLREHASSVHVLSAAERDTLLREAKTLELSIEPIAGTDDSYSVTAGSKVGAVEIGDLSVFLEPKMGIPQLLSLACYAMGVFRSQQDNPFGFEEGDALPDVLAIALASAAHGAFARGLLHGYREEEGALQTVRGRIRLDDQIRRRSGFVLPVEVRYDDFTDDILENRLVKAATSRLSGMRLRSTKARGELSWIAGTLEQVSLVEFRANDVPETRFDRLNEHYRDVVGLARLVLRHSEFESGRGEVRASGFLMDMNRLFQDFLTATLREALGVSTNTLRSDHQIMLDVDGQARLKPDLSWWDGSTCTFVGDFGVGVAGLGCVGFAGGCCGVSAAGCGRVCWGSGRAKYKSCGVAGHLTGKRVAPGADLYQLLLAYATALDLPGGLLVYAQGEADTASYLVRHSGKRLDVVALDLSGSPSEGVRYRVESMSLHEVLERTNPHAPRPDRRVHLECAQPQDVRARASALRRGAGPSVA